MQNLEKEMNRYRTDCMNIMKYCNMQKQLIKDLDEQTTESLEDKEFLDCDQAQTKVDNIKLKLALAAIHNNNENIAVSNSKAQSELDEIINSEHEQGMDESTLHSVTNN